MEPTPEAEVSNPNPLDRSLETSLGFAYSSTGLADREIRRGLAHLIDAARTSAATGQLAYDITIPPDDMKDSNPATHTARLKASMGAVEQYLLTLDISDRYKRLNELDRFVKIEVVDPDGNKIEGGKVPRAVRRSTGITAGQEVVYRKIDPSKSEFPDAGNDTDYVVVAGIKVKKQALKRQLTDETPDNPRKSGELKPMYGIDGAHLFTRTTINGGQVINMIQVDYTSLSKLREKLGMDEPQNG